MNRFTRACAAIAVLSGSFAIAQGPIVPPLLLERIERPWPATMPGVDTSLACGRFVADHPGRGVVVVRDGRLHFWFAPANLDLCVATDFTGAQAICTVPSMDASPDLLAVSTAAGLRMLRWNGDTFVDAFQGQGAIADWIDARDFATFVAPTLSSRLLLARAPGWVRCTIVDPGGFVQPGIVFPAPITQAVLDAEYVNWVPGGLPEVAVLTTAGTFVLDASGNVLAAYAQTAAGGVLKAVNRNDPPVLVQIRQLGVDWRVETFFPTGPFTPVDGGLLPVSRPVIGVGVCDINGDAWADLVVSTGESLRRILLGRSEGFSATTAYRIDFFDVEEQAPGPQAPNLSPLVVDDIDRDGNQDFVVAHRNSNQLVVTYRVRPQVQLAVFQIQDEGGTVPSLTFAKTLGGTRDVPLPIPNWSEQYVHFPQVQLPTQLPANAAVDAIVYRRPVGPDETPTPDDEAHLGAIAHFRYPVASTVGGQLFDLMLPIHEAQVFAADMGPAARFVVELCVIEDVPGKAPVSTAPIFLECAVNYDLYVGGSELEAYLDASLLPPPWWAHDLLFDENGWNNGVQSANSVTETPTDARYFGVVVALKEPKAGGKPSAPPPSTGNGVVHH